MRSGFWGSRFIPLAFHPTQHHAAFRVWGFRARVFGFGVLILGSGIRVEGVGSGFLGSTFMVLGFGLGSRCKVWV